MDPRIIALYDEYTHGPLPRRVFLKRLRALAGGAAAASALLPLLENNYAEAAMVAPNDPRLEISKVSWQGSTSTMNGMLAHPKGSGRLPSVIVIHENRGLNPHIEDVTRRLALEGFTALGVDFLSPLGGTPSDEDKARDMFSQLNAQQTTANAVASLQFLEKHALSNGRVGAIGFCWGGGLVNQLAVASPDLDAGVAYYGSQPAAADVAKIKAPIMLQYASLDERINAGIAAYETVLKAAGTRYQIHMYEGVNHAFNNDTTAARYNADAAKLAWQRTVAFLKQYLTTNA